MDISKCIGTKCIKKEKCLRFIGKGESGYQSITDLAPICFNENYSYFIAIEEGKKEKNNNGK